MLGDALGMARGLKQRPAGLRTYMLVRMSSQVVSGIGFYGAGTIIVTRHNQIKGPTTAAGLWAELLDEVLRTASDAKIILLSFRVI